MKRRLFALLCTVMLVFCLFPLPAEAAEEMVQKVNEVKNDPELFRKTQRNPKPEINILNVEYNEPRYSYKENRAQTEYNIQRKSYNKNNEQEKIKKSLRIEKENSNFK